MTPRPPSLVEAARELLSACYSDTRSIAKEVSDVCESAKVLPNDAVVVSAALLRRAAHYIASMPLEGSMDVYQALHAAADGAAGEGM
jgi:hypothetical protein